MSCADRHLHIRDAAEAVTANCPAARAAATQRSEIRRLRQTMVVELHRLREHAVNGEEVVPRLWTVCPAGRPGLEIDAMTARSHTESLNEICTMLISVGRAIVVVVVERSRLSGRKYADGQRVDPMLTDVIHHLL